MGRCQWPHCLMASRVGSLVQLSGGLFARSFPPGVRASYARLAGAGETKTVTHPPLSQRGCRPPHTHALSYTTCDAPLCGSRKQRRRLPVIVTQAAFFSRADGLAFAPLTLLRE